MTCIYFEFCEQASEADQDQIRGEIRTLPGVQNIGRLLPGKPTWFAEVEDDAATELVERLRQRSDIVNPHVPKPRGLVW
jgi:hypothetical protein